MLKKNTIVNYVKDNEGIATIDVVNKFSKDYSIKTESIKNYIYNLKLKNFLEEKSKKLYPKNPFDEKFKEILESENQYELYKNLADLNNSILIVLRDISPSAEKKLRDLLNESLLIVSYRYPQDINIKRGKGK